MVSQLKIVETVFNKLKNFPATVIFMNQNILTPAVPAFYFMNKKNGECIRAVAGASAF